MAAMTTDAWKGMFREIGLSEDDMNRWHQIFEQNYPEAHQSFLKWLNLDDHTIKQIREDAKQ